MTRRLLLLVSLAFCLRADSEQEVVDLIASAATGLSADNPDVFLDAFDPAMPGYDKLRDSILALTSAAKLSCSIDVKSNEGDDAARSLELDWILRIDHKDGSTGSTRRQQTVKCRLKKSGKKWRIVALEPVDFFALPR
ncbi:MAG TPA: hypothetical protein VLW65_10705 [Bryobacteraceae bacterium]|nr:hypothetical protein [Bryobacteraceae bacterium]